MINLVCAVFCVQKRVINKNSSPNHESYFPTHFIYNQLDILILGIFKDKPGLCSFLRTKESYQ